MMPKDTILFKIVHTCAKECLILKDNYIQNPWHNQNVVLDSKKPSKRLMSFSPTPYLQTHNILPLTSSVLFHDKGLTTAKNEKVDLYVPAIKFIG